MFTTPKRRVLIFYTAFQTPERQWTWRPDIDVRTRRKIIDSSCDSSALFVPGLFSKERERSSVLVATDGSGPSGEPTQPGSCRLERWRPRTGSGGALFTGVGGCGPSPQRGASGDLASAGSDRSGRGVEHRASLFRSDRMYV